MNLTLNPLLIISSLTLLLSCRDSETEIQMQIVNKKAYHLEYILATYPNKIDTVYYLYIDLNIKDSLFLKVNHNYGVSFSAKRITDSIPLINTDRIYLTLRESQTHANRSDGNFLIYYTTNRNIIMNTLMETNRIKFYLTTIRELNTAAKISGAMVAADNDSIYIRQFL